MGRCFSSVVSSSVAIAPRDDGERFIQVAQTKRLMRGMRAIVCGHVMEARVIEESISGMISVLESRN